MVVITDLEGQGGNVTFYRDMELLGELAMPRRLTDCNNGLEGILLGDSGLMLGQARSAHLFWSRATIRRFLGIRGRIQHNLQRFLPAGGILSRSARTTGHRRDLRRRRDPQ